MEMESLKVPPDLMSNTARFGLRDSPPLSGEVFLYYPVLQALFKVVESCHEEKLLQEKFRVQHGNVCCPTYQCVGGVWQSVEHVVSDQSAVLRPNQRLEQVVNHFCINRTCKRIQISHVHVKGARSPLSFQYHLIVMRRKMGARPKCKDLLSARRLLV